MGVLRDKNNGLMRNQNQHMSRSDGGACATTCWRIGFNISGCVYCSGVEGNWFKISSGPLSGTCYVTVGGSGGGTSVLWCGGSQAIDSTSTSVGEFFSPLWVGGTPPTIPATGCPLTTLGISLVSPSEDPFDFYISPSFGIGVSVPDGSGISGSDIGFTAALGSQFNGDPPAVPNYTIRSLFTKNISTGVASYYAPVTFTYLTDFSGITQAAVGYGASGVPAPGYGTISGWALAGSITVTPDCVECDCVKQMSPAGPGVGTCCEGTTPPPSCQAHTVLLGTSGTFESDFAGSLTFLFNDTIGGFANNSGSFNINWSTGVINVPATASAGVTVPIAAGTSYSYTAGGICYYTPGGAPIGPGGDPSTSTDSYAQWTQAPDERFAALVGIFTCTTSPPPPAPVPCDLELSSPLTYNVSGNLYSIADVGGVIVQTLVGAFTVTVAPDGDPATIWLPTASTGVSLPNGLNLYVGNDDEAWTGSDGDASPCYWVVGDASDDGSTSGGQYFVYGGGSSTDAAGNYPDNIPTFIPTQGNGSAGYIIRDVTVTAV